MPRRRTPALDAPAPDATPDETAARLEPFTWRALFQRVARVWDDVLADREGTP